MIYLLTLWLAAKNDIDGLNLLPALILDVLGILGTTLVLVSYFNGVHL